MSNVAADALSLIHENNNQLDGASCYHKWCEDVSVPVSCIQHSDVNALLMGYSTNDQPHKDAMMAADLNRESTVPVPYRVAGVHNLRVVRDWPVIQNKDSDIRMVKNIIREGTIMS